MLIGDVAKDTTIKIYYDTPKGSYEFETVALEAGDTHFELLVRTVMTEDNRFVKFETGEGFKLRIELIGDSQYGLRVDSIDFCYSHGKTFHVIRSRGHIAVNNKRETFRLPFSIECDVELAGHRRTRGKVHNISFEGIAILLNKEDSAHLAQNSIMTVKFNWGIPATTFDLRCKVMRIQERDLDINVIGCTLERGTNSIRTLIMHLQMEEARKKKGLYTLKR